MPTLPSSRTRRLVLKSSTGLAALGAVPSLLLSRAVYAQGSTPAPAIVSTDASRPSLAFGLQFGDPRIDAAAGAAPSASVLAWTRADRLSRLKVEWSLDEGFSNATTLPLLTLVPGTDHTGRIDLRGLPPGRQVFVRMTPLGIDSPRVQGEAVRGSFRTPTNDAGNLRFVWSGDTGGQGWGISPSHGGMKTYRTMLEQSPAFFIHSGDTIYADGPIAAEQKLPGDDLWRNLVTEEKSKVAETLDEFRGNYRYNLMDEHVRAFNAQVPQIWQWDDHEVTNNWSASKDLSTNDKYREKRIGVLAARAAQAFLEYAPIRLHGDEERDRVYRRIPQGPLLDLLMVDMRSYRGANSANLQASYDADSHFMGPAQIAWLKTELKRSAATWKVIGADMPIGLQVGDGKEADGKARWEAIANGEAGAPLGREQEIADLLAFIKREKIRNVVWLTADVHYCAAHHYSPERAAFKDFEPFWEFVSGPLHAGGFGPAKPDATFGLEVVFEKAPKMQNEAPTDANQFFGQVDIDAASKAMTVALKDRSGATVFEKRLDAA
ncbi:MAG: alkaline phosphatase [Lautropia sp.]